MTAERWAEHANVALALAAAELFVLGFLAGPLGGSVDVNVAASAGFLGLHLVLRMAWWRAELRELEADGLDEDELDRIAQGVAEAVVASFLPAGGGCKAPDTCRPSTPCGACWPTLQ